MATEEWSWHPRYPSHLPGPVPEPPALASIAGTKNIALAPIAATTTSAAIRGGKRRRSSMVVSALDRARVGTALPLRRIAEARAEQPVEVGNIGKAGLQCDIGDAALALARLSQQRVGALQAQLGHSPGKGRSGHFQQPLHIAGRDAHVLR